MATLKLELFDAPRDELAATVDGDVPDWMQRLYRSFGTTAEAAPASASVEALGEELGHRFKKMALLLRKMEAMGWWIEPQCRHLLAHTVLTEPEAQAQLESAGVWIIARQHAPIDKDGNVRWGRGLLP